MVCVRNSSVCLRGLTQFSKQPSEVSGHSFFFRELSPSKDKITRMSLEPRASGPRIPCTPAGRYVCALCPFCVLAAMQVGRLELQPPLWISSEVQGGRHASMVTQSVVSAEEQAMTSNLDVLH